MSVDPVTGLIASEIISETASTIQSERKAFLKKAGKITANMYDSFITTLNGDFEVKKKEITILCDTKKKKFTTSLIMKKTPILDKKIPIIIGSRPSLAQLTPVLGNYCPNDAIEYTDNGFIVHINKLSPDEIYLLDAEYPLEDNRLINNLVEKYISPDTPVDNGDVREYELSAYLKQPDMYIDQFKNVSLRDIELKVDVNINKDINTAIPSKVVKKIEAMYNMSKIKEPYQRQQAFNKYTRMERGTGFSGSEFDIYEALKLYFTPQKFKKFIDIQGIFFKYYDCKPGANPYKPGTPALPDSMEVTSKTNLSTDKPAANGIMIYKYNSFIDEIMNLIDKYEKEDRDNKYGKRRDDYIK